jgi:Tfp pilus assembly protein FimT
MCRSTAPEATPPECAKGAQGNGWTSGWIIYYDSDGNSTIDPDDILRVQSRIEGIELIQEGSNPKSASKSIEFTPTGRLRSLGSMTTFDFGGSAYSKEVRRCVALAVGGRARVFQPAPNC